MKKFKYAGIGSRKTPPEILGAMRRLGGLLGTQGWTLRSGGAQGADSAFEEGCTLARGMKEIFYASAGQDRWCRDMAIRYVSQWRRDNWGQTSDYVVSLHARNMKQVLGNNGDDPVDALICWTNNGGPTGGTGTAIRCAMDHNIPIYNLYLDDYDAILNKLNHGSLNRETYCGRGKQGSIPTRPHKYGWLGNPVKLGTVCAQCGEVHRGGGETLECYKRYLWVRMQDEEWCNAFYETCVGKDLLCFCKNKEQCHTSVMERALKWLEENK